MMKIYHQSVFDKWEIEDKSVQAIITSPPYYSLRKYDIPDVIIGGDKDCKHEFEQIVHPPKGGHSHPDRPPNVGANKTEMDGEISIRFGYQSNQCIKCHAWKGQHGLEPSFKLYLEHCKLWMQEAIRVLRHDWVIFVNLGPSYSNQADTIEYELRDDLTKEELNYVLSELFKRDGK